MILQISSGQGPMECELAVQKLLTSLQKEGYTYIQNNQNLSIILK